MATEGRASAAALAEKPNRELVAMALEDDAARSLETLLDAPGSFDNDADPIAIAHVQATLALGQRVADLTDRLGEYLGDDSHLDGIKRAIRDNAHGQ